ncbi:MAG: C-terminal target protein [Bacteroidota bacterium]|jgi:hypothetical protein|nr:C-terminal target protein [Bacteroidota bacterium]
MKHTILAALLAVHLFIGNNLFSQCPNNGSLVAGLLTPPSVGSSTSQTYGAGQYMLAFVSAGANYNVSTCGSSAYDTQLTVYDDATGTYYAYNDDACGLQSNLSFTASSCGYVRILLSQYSCNNSGSLATVTMTMNTAGSGTSPVLGTTVITDVVCFGGSDGAIDLTPSGGVAPYTYSWLPSGPTTEDLTSLTAGTFSVLITDVNGCNDTVTAVVAQPDPVSGTTVVTNVACFGGTNGAINLTPSGGTGPYTFNWLPSGPTTEDRTGLVAATYSVVIIDNNACTGTVTASVTQPTAPVAGTTVVTNVTCFGGSNGAINLTPSGGTGPYTFNWLPSGPTTEDRTGLVAGTYTVVITDNNGCTATVTVSVTQPTGPVSGTTVVTNVACFGGSNGAINLTPNGGTGPYTFSWLPSGPTTEDRTGLVAGTYTVVITDANGCTGTVTRSVTQPTSPVSGTTVVTNVACFGGSNGAVNLTPNGGTGPYTFNWLPSGPTTEDRTGLTAGTYTVVITDNNACTATATASVTQPTSPVSGTTVVTNVTCFGGSNGAINLTPSGGTGPYTFNWLPSGPTTEDRTGLTAGTYTVVITDNKGCTGTVTASVTEAPAIVVTPLSQTDVACNGGSTGSASVSASGGTNALTYNWTPGTPAGDGSNSVTGLTAGTWTVTVTDANGCLDTQSFSITQNSVITATTSQINISCNGGANGTATVNATGGAGGFTYSWAPAGGTAATATGLAAGNYTVTITDLNGCSTTRSFTITEPAVLTAGSSAPGILCNGGTTIVTATGTGGTIPYTGAGSFSVTAGTHSYTVTDANGCTASTSITVTEPSALSASSSATTILCNGGTADITVSATGGTLAYSGTGTFTMPAGTYNYTVTDANGCTSPTSITIIEPLVLIASSTSTTILCNGGIADITVTATGGTGAYTGTNTFSVSAGTYTYPVSDANGCSTSTSITVTEPSALMAMSSATTILCNGATADVTVNAMDGTAPYSGIGTFTVNAGTYNYTVTDDNGCASTTTVVVTEPSAVTASTTTTNSNCGNTTGTATVFASGGTGALAYLWSTNGTAATETGLSAGSYTVTVTDANSCSSTAIANVSDTGAPTVTSSSLNATCNGATDGSIDISVTGGAGSYTYLWDNNATTEDLNLLIAGVYSYTVADAAGCEATGSVTISEPNAIDVTTSVNVLTITANNTGAVTYQWIDCNTNTAIANEINQSFTALIDGSYAVVITDGVCSDTSACVAIVGNGIATSVNNSPISISPNPNSGVFTIKASFKGTYRIANELGQNVRTMELNADNNFSINIDGLTNGIYFITGVSNQKVINQKIVVTQ